MYARWTQHANRASDATYTVTHANGSTQVPVDQKVNGGAWNLLGTFSLSPGTAHKVTLTDQANGYVIADAIRLVPVAIQAEQKLYFVHTDHLNTPRLVADATGTTVWRWDQQEPFGNNPADENPSGLGTFDLPLRLPGQRYDKETGLHYSYFRDYDPGLGRFPQFDPIGLRGGINGYAYVDSNPLSRIDPFGLAAASAGGEKMADCGPEGGWMNRFVPNNPRGYPFQKCCDAHDKCYDKCFGPDKLSCDSDACDCFKKACGSSGSATSACLRIAQGYCYRILYSETADEQFRKARAKCKSSSACIPSPTL